MTMNLKSAEFKLDVMVGSCILSDDLRDAARHGRDTIAAMRNRRDLLPDFNAGDLHSEVHALANERDALLDAAIVVIGSWEKGDLAGATRKLAAVVARVTGSEGPY